MLFRRGKWNRMYSKHHFGREKRKGQNICLQMKQPNTWTPFRLEEKETHVTLLAHKMLESANPHNGRRWHTDSIAGTRLTLPRTNLIMWANTAFHYSHWFPPANGNVLIIKGITGTLLPTVHPHVSVQSMLHTPDIPIAISNLSRKKNHAG